MIDHIVIKNYKAFKEAIIPFKPITVFLGANNAGKSSIIRLLLMLQQTATADPTTYNSALKLHGILNMGKPEYLFYRMDKTKNITLCFSIRDNQLNLFFKEINKAKDIYQRMCEVASMSSIEKKTSTVETQLYWDAHQSGYVSFFNFNDFISPSKDIEEKTARVKELMSKIASHSEKNTSSTEFEIIYKIGYNAKQQCLVVKGFTLKYYGKKIINIKKSINNTWTISSEFVEFESSDIKAISKNISDNKSIFYFIKKDDFYSKSLLSKTILSLINKCIDNLREEFDDKHINFVQPLRAHPQRYYMLNNINSINVINTLDGNELAEVLKDNKNVREQVNTWLKRFGLSEIDVKKDIEIIHHLILKQNGLDLDISDVGFGISQLLPIVTQGFLSRPHSATIIEQPEIHLHPRLQADLADLFIDVVKMDFNTKSSEYERTVIIETHSEYLLRRLRRRMSEGDTITPDNVSICLFHPYIEGKNNSASIENLKIEKKGAFEWPEEFYGKELQDDITLFLTNQR